MTARLRLRSNDPKSLNHIHHAEEQLAAIMHASTATGTSLVLGPTQSTHADWLPVHWNPANVRVVGQRPGVLG